MKKGSKHTPEAIQRITENNARRGKKFTFTEAHIQNLSKANKGQIPWIKGRKQTPDHIRQRVDAIRASGAYDRRPKGRDHYLWIEDRTQVKHYWTERNNPEYKQWREAVKTRDGKCRLENENCSGNLIVHHILGWTAYPKERYNVNNGITLCHAHHPRKREEEHRLAPMLQRLVNN